MVCWFMILVQNVTITDITAKAIPAAITVVEAIAATEEKTWKR